MPFEIISSFTLSGSSPYSMQHGVKRFYALETKFEARSKCFLTFNEHCAKWNITSYLVILEMSNFAKNERNIMSQQS